MYGITGAPTGETVTLPGRHFDVPLRVDIAHRVVVWQRSKRRGVYAKTLTRSEVRDDPEGEGARRPGRSGAADARQWGGARPAGCQLEHQAAEARATGGAAGALHKGCGGEDRGLDSTGASAEPSGWTALDTSAQSLAAGGRAHSVLCRDSTHAKQGGLPARRACARSGRKLPAVHSNAKRASLSLPHGSDQFGLNVYDVLRRSRHHSDALDALVARLDRRSTGSRSVSAAGGRMRRRCSTDQPQAPSRGGQGTEEGGRVQEARGEEGGGAGVVIFVRCDMTSST